MEKANAFLETEKISVLMRKYAVPCIISLLVAALYKIVVQIFMVNGKFRLLWKQGQYSGISSESGDSCFRRTNRGRLLHLCQHLSWLRRKRGRTQEYWKFHTALYSGKHCHSSGLFDFSGTHADIIRRQGQQGYLLFCQEVFLLDYIRHSFLSI